MDDIKIEFIRREHGPERLVCEAELYFLTGSLAGLKFVGFSLWKSPEGELYVTFPSRAFGAGSDRRYFDYIRVIEGEHAGTKKLKTLILEAYEAQKPILEAMK